MMNAPDPGQNRSCWRGVGRAKIVSFMMRTAVALGLAAIFGGCGLSGLDGDAAGPSDEPAPASEPPPAVVTIRFRNLAVDEAVNVEFYATHGPVTDLPDDLFVEQNLITENVGIAGTGILEPLREDTLSYPCSDQLVIGTLGGTFLDNETGELRGHGVARWAQDVALELCGRRVLIEYSYELGTFGTRIAVGN